MTEMLCCFGMAVGLALLFIGFIGFWFGGPPRNPFDDWGPRR